MGTVPKTAASQWVGMITPVAHRDNRNMQAFKVVAKCGKDDRGSARGKGLTTRVTIIWDGGIGGEAEDCLHAHPAWDIVMAAHTAIEQVVSNPIKVIDGAWSWHSVKGKTPHLTGNFSYVIKGVVLSPNACLT